MHLVLIGADTVETFLIERQRRREAAIARITAFRLLKDAVDYLHQQAACSRLLEVLLLSLQRPLQVGWDNVNALWAAVRPLHGQCRVYVLIAALWPQESLRLQQHLMVAGVLHKPLDGPQLRRLLAHAQ